MRLRRRCSRIDSRPLVHHRRSSVGHQGRSSGGLQSPHRPPPMRPAAFRKFWVPLALPVPFAPRHWQIQWHPKANIPRIVEALATLQSSWGDRRPRRREVREGGRPRHLRASAHPGYHTCRVPAPDRGASDRPPRPGHCRHDRPPRGQRAAGRPPFGDDPSRADAGGLPRDLRLVRLPADRDPAHRAHGSPDRQGGRLRRGPPPDLRGHEQGGHARRAGPAVRPDGPPGPVRREARRGAGHPLQALRHRLGLPGRAAGEGAVPRVHAVRLRHRRHREPLGRRRDGPGRSTRPSRRRACRRSRSR